MQAQRATGGTKDINNQNFGKKQAKWACPLKQFIDESRKNRLSVPPSGVGAVRRASNATSLELCSEEGRSVNGDWGEDNLDNVSVGRPRTPWEEFTQELQEVDSYSSGFTLTPRAAPLKVNSSVQFDHVMRELGWPGGQGECDPRNNWKLDESDELIAEDKDNDEEAEEDLAADTDQLQNSNGRQKQAAKRAWAWVRRNVQEVSVAEKSKTSSLNWNVLHHTMANLSDMEQSRQDLYRRYLDKPNSWREGIQNFPTQLLQKPPPARPVSVHEASTKDTEQASASRISSSVRSKSRQRRQKALQSRSHTTLLSGV